MSLPLCSTLLLHSLRSSTFPRFTKEKVKSNEFLLSLSMFHSYCNRSVFIAAKSPPHAITKTNKEMLLGSVMPFVKYHAYCHRYLLLLLLLHNFISLDVETDTSSSSSSSSNVFEPIEKPIFELISDAIDSI